MAEHCLRYSLLYKQGVVDLTLSHIYWTSRTQLYVGGLLLFDFIFSEYNL